MQLIDILTLSLTLCFWVLFLTRTLMLARQGVKVFVMAKGKTWREKLVELALMPLLTLWSVQILLTAIGRPPFGLPTLWASTPLRWLGVALCAVGLVIFVAALVSFGSAWRVGIDEKGSNRLVTTGAFARSRNPIFVFMDIFFLGVFLVYPTLFFGIFFVCFASGIHTQILNEERFLRGHFGDEYAAYCQKVRRYF